MADRLGSTASPGVARRAWLGAAAGAILAPCSLAASAAGASATRSSAAPSSLTIAAFPALDAIVRAAQPAWAERHPGVALKIVSRQFADHHTAMTTALSTAVHLPDLMALEVGYVGRFARGSGLQDLRQPPFDILRFQSQFVPYALQQAVGRGGAIVAMPADIGPGTLLVRTDLLAKAGVAEAALTRSWDSYVGAGVVIKRATGAYLLSHAREIKNLLIRTGVQPGQGLYFDNANQVLVNTPRFNRAFELAREVRRNKLDARVADWSNEWTEGFRRGTLATQLTGAWLVGHLNNWLAPATRGLWRALPLPEDAQAAFGGAFWALPRKANPAHQALAWELLQMLTLDREAQLRAFKTQDAFPALASVHDDPFFEQPIEFLAGQRARLLWRDAARRIPAVAVHKQDAFAGEVIDTELDLVLERGKSIPQALADAAGVLQQRATR